MADDEGVSKDITTSEAHMGWDLLSQGDPYDEEDVYLLDDQLTERAYQVYAEGGCWYLAWVLHRKLPTSRLYLWVTAEDHDLLFHAWVRLENGHLLDIFGEEDEVTKEARYDRDLRTHDLGRPDKLEHYSNFVYGMPRCTEDDIPEEFRTWTEQVADHLIAQI